MLTTRLDHIRKHHPCADGWKKLLAHLGKTQTDDEPLPYSVIVESNGLDDALWCCRAEPQHAREWRLYACWCVRQAWHLLTDERSRDAVRVAERHAFGAATDDQLAAAQAAAWAAAQTAARRSVRAAEWAAVQPAEWAAEWAAAREAAWAAAKAAAKEAAREAAWAAAWAAAARAAAWDKQSAEFLRLCADPEAWAAEYRSTYMEADNAAA